MSKPTIGVTTSVSKGRFTWLCIRLSFWLAGGKAYRIHANKHDHFTQHDGYLIAGGVDIDPSCYGQSNTASKHIEPERDALEKQVITHALQSKKPLAGICRGCQMINVVTGGSLHQDARSVFTDFLPTSSLLAKVFQRRRVSLNDSGRIATIFFNQQLSVNSIHHQAIHQLGKGLIVSAKDKHNIPQAIESTTEQVVFGVQWHPELMLYNKRQLNFFKHLINACKIN